MKRGTKRFAEDSRYNPRQTSSGLYSRDSYYSPRINSRREGKTVGEEDGSSCKEITLVVVGNDAKYTTCYIARYIAIFRRRGDNNIGTSGG